MPVPKLNPVACARRNAAAALEGRCAAPLTLSAVPPPGPPDGYRVVTASGTLPKDDAEAVARINASLGLSGSDALAPGRVLLTYPEVANGNYIDKYFMFLGLSTLKNVAAAGADGIALMNSHRTGGMSAPAELPYGYTFCSRLETLAAPSGAREYRVILGGYMLAGVHPNGANGPSTDELHAGITAGTLRDVSLGFSDAGRPVCDVCGRDATERDEEGDYLCRHVPGTHRGMDAEMIAAQEARGVPGGVATFTLEDAHVSELSACYSGALPGAAFRKAARLARRGLLAGAELGAARLAFAPLLTAAPDAFGPAPRPGPEPPDPTPKKGTAAVALKLADVYAFWDATGRPKISLQDLQAQLEGVDPPPAPGTAAGTPPAPAPGPPPTGPDQTVARQLQAMREEMDAKDRAREAERAAERAASVALEADRWVDSMIRLGRATAAERPALAGLYAQAAADDRASPVQFAFTDAAGKPASGGRLDALKANVMLRPASAAGVPQVAGNPAALAAARAAALAAGADPSSLPAEPPPRDDLKAIYELAAGWGRRRNGSATGARGLAAAR